MINIDDCLFKLGYDNLEVTYLSPTWKIYRFTRESKIFTIESFELTGNTFIADGLMTRIIRTKQDLFNIILGKPKKIRLK